MARTIRIDEDVYLGLKKLADPFEDTPNTVIRKLLQMEGPSKNEEKKKIENKFDSRQINDSGLIPQPVYEEWLLYTLFNEFNGSGGKHEVTKAVLASMEKKQLLGERDRETVSTGETRAENTIAWGRNRLKEMGLIQRGSRRGIWELTEKGINRAREIQLQGRFEKS